MHVLLVGNVTLVQWFYVIGCTDWHLVPFLSIQWPFFTLESHTVLIPIHQPLYVTHHHETPMLCMDAPIVQFGKCVLYTKTCKRLC